MSTRFVLPILAAAFVTGCMKVNTAPPSKPAAEQVTLRVKAEDLIKDYRENSAAADQKYKDKVLEVTGRVLGVQQNGLYGYSLQLGVDTAGKNQFDADMAVVQERQGIVCMLGHTAVAKEAAAQLKKDELVKVRGLFEGRSFGILTLNKATVVK